MSSSPLASDRRPAAVLFGCAGPKLSEAERAFFRAADPLGFILFRRNCVSPEQVRELVAALRACVGRAEAPVLIDQEGGRVARLAPPVWPKHPPARRIGACAELDPTAGERAAWLNARLIAAMLEPLGITVDCAPVCDVPEPGAHDVIGDRAFSERPELVARLATAACAGFLAGGVLPVIKHIPGHGRARADSHRELPVVDTPAATLANTDFVPFHALSAMPVAMVAHVLYRDLDPERPASISPRVIEEVIRGTLGFQGFLVSDDVEMEALAGGPGERAAAVLAAGCDAVLHCSGKFQDMVAVAEATGPLTLPAWMRWQQASARLERPASIDLAAARAELAALLPDEVS